MCQDKNILIFCTCLETKDDLIKIDHAKQYLWTLTKFVGTKETLMRGKIVQPKDDLGYGVTIENVLNQLNSGINHFDFEYIPNEKDCLCISVTVNLNEIEYLKILYKDEKWIKGSHPAFVTISEEIRKGVVYKNDSK